MQVEKLSPNSTHSATLSTQTKFPFKNELRSSSQEGRDIPKAMKSYGVDNLTKNRSSDQNCKFDSLQEIPGVGLGGAKLSVIKQIHDCHTDQLDLANRTPSVEAKLGLLFTDAAHVILDRSKP
jgi:hypothetical protein